MLISKTVMRESNIYLAFFVFQKLLHTYILNIKRFDASNTRIHITFYFYHDNWNCTSVRGKASKWHKLVPIGNANLIWRNEIKIKCRINDVIIQVIIIIIIVQMLIDLYVFLSYIELGNIESIYYFLLEGHSAFRYPGNISMTLIIMQQT